MEKKDTINSAGNYTHPKLRRAIVLRIKRGNKGGPPNKWTARKAQMVPKIYKAKGGGYKS